MPSPSPRAQPCSYYAYSEMLSLTSVSLFGKSSFLEMNSCPVIKFQGPQVHSSLSYIPKELGEELVPITVLATKEGAQPGRGETAGGDAHPSPRTPPAPPQPTRNRSRSPGR